MKPPQSFVLAWATAMSLSPASAAPAATQFLVYVGTYTGPKSKGIYVCRMDAERGTLSSAELAVETVKPVNPVPNKIAKPMTANGFELRAASCKDSRPARTLACYSRFLFQVLRYQIG